MVVLSGGLLRSARAGVAVRCPRGWDAAADVGVVGIELVRRDESEDAVLAAVLVVTEPVPQQMTLAGYAERQLALLGSHADALRLLDDQPAELCGARARRVLAAFRSGPVHLTGDLWWALADGRAVVLAGACPSPTFPHYEPTFSTLAEGVSLEPSSAVERSGSAGA